MRADRLVFLSSDEQILCQAELAGAQHPVGNGQQLRRLLQLLVRSVPLAPDRE
ncbi:hypothetical protein D3C73_1412760 [compost metagenome]